jgi:hypothetical protein
MRIEYWCRHCYHLVGELNQPGWTLADAERYCGIHALTAQERSEWVAYDGYPGVMTVQTVCEHCQQALEQNPELLIEGKVLQ